MRKLAAEGGLDGVLVQDVAFVEHVDDCLAMRSKPSRAKQKPASLFGGKAADSVRSKANVALSQHRLEWSNYKFRRFADC